jgi:RNA polymerase sigma-70 factor, ECF subfamily
MNSACGDAKERPCDAAHTPHFQRPAKHAQSTEGQPAGQRVWASPEPIVMATVKGYLFTIARHLFLHALRKSSRHDALDEDLRDPRVGPAGQAEQSARLQSVLKELQKLPEASRSALLMYAVDGMAYEEIARVLDISLPALKVKIHRARLALAGVRDA